MTINIDCETADKLELPYEEIIRNVVLSSLEYENCPYEAEVNVVLTDNEEIHKLNLEYRGIDRPTDVCLFPCWSMTHHRIFLMWRRIMRTVLIRRPES